MSTCERITLAAMKKKTSWAHIDDAGTYRVELAHWPDGAYGERGPNRWAVYVFVYPKHPLFARFIGRDLWQEATSGLPGHSYCSFLKCHTDDDGKPCSWQAGWDYGHDTDARYSHYTADEAGVFLYDVERMIDAMEELKTEATPPAAGGRS